jgi:hypothetical protein
VIDLGEPLRRFTLPDDRPLAHIALSPQGPGSYGYFEENGESSTQSVTRAMLVMTGNNDRNSGNDLLGVVRRETWENLPGGNSNQYLFHSNLPEGVGRHVTYNLHDYQSDDLRVRDLSRALASVARAFLDHIVLGDPMGAAYLASTSPLILAGLEVTELLVK